MSTQSKKSLYQLFKQDPEKAWQKFLSQYNNFIMTVINKMVQDHDDRMEMYSYALEKFRENDFKKLSAYFEKPRPYDFKTWLAIITKNCCMDWFRQEKGRKRLLKCIKDLPELDQWIFRYIYWQKYPYEICYEQIKTKHGYNGSFSDFYQRVDHISDILNKQTKWNLTNTWFSVISTLPIEEMTDQSASTVDPGINPDQDFVQSDFFLRCGSLKTNPLQHVLTDCFLF